MIDRDTYNIFYGIGVATAAGTAAFILAYAAFRWASDSAIQLIGG